MQLHLSFLKANEYDEGDLIFYRISYRLADSLHISKEAAERLHSKYHELEPRRVSQGYCDTCGKVVSLVPIIYGVQKSELAELQAREREGRIILGDTSTIKEGGKVALFGCRECKSSLPKYGTL